MTTTQTTFPAPLPVRARRRVPILRLTWMLARPGTQSPAALILPAVAFGVTSALLVIVAGGTAMFWRITGDEAIMYRILSALALSLLIVPLLGLGAAAARLSARRRDDRLASLRLIGATGADVTRVTVLESTVIALLGALGGVLLALATSPLVGLISFRGHPIGAEELWIGPGPMALIIVGVTLLAAISSVVGLRRVVISPLGVRTRQRKPQPHWVRPLIALAALIAISMVLQSLGALNVEVGIALAIGGAVAVGLAVLGLVGPWLLSVWAKLQLRRAKTVPQLITARAILDNPGAIWRQVGGVAMTSFVAVVAGSGIGLVLAIDDGTTGSDGFETLPMDIFTGIVVVLIGSFLMVAVSVGINQAALVMDRRDISVSLDRLGMPREMIEAARSRQAIAPVLVVSITAAIIGGAVVFPLTGMALLLSPSTIGVVLASILIGLTLVWLAVRATRPIQRVVLAQPERA
ncbi:FtsX-like permease family protein [Mycetocola sp. JXN-3]|uniref:FtsX-like permease family protein n=1 Tax=Mycetocola sp. JXN-3 TaxID=2116510 RepID=UPI002102697D|nr:FtsX-like permease family protein [Mycetocola sp. JXN-3]